MSEPENKFIVYTTSMFYKEAGNLLYIYVCTLRQKKKLSINIKYA